MTSDDYPRRCCGSYQPGHDVHWIQWHNGSQDTVNLPRSGRLIDVDDAGNVVIEVDGTVLRLWNHDPERLRILVAHNDGAILYQSRWDLLYTAADRGRYVFCVCPEDSPDRLPCLNPDAPSPRDFIEQANEAGGFLISAIDLRRAIQEAEDD